MTPADKESLAIIAAFPLLVAVYAVVLLYLFCESVVCVAIASWRSLK